MNKPMRGLKSDPERLNSLRFRTEYLSNPKPKITSKINKKVIWSVKKERKTFCGLKNRREISDKSSDSNGGAK